MSMLSVAVAHTSSDDSAMLPVLWMFWHSEANGPESKTLCFVKFARWRHRRRNCCLWLHAWSNSAFYYNLLLLLLLLSAVSLCLIGSLSVPELLYNGCIPNREPRKQDF